MTYPEEVFVAVFQPVCLPRDARDGLFSKFDTLEEALAHVPKGADALDHVWTVTTDHECQDQFIGSGIHAVNRDGFVVSTVSSQGLMVDFEICWDATFLTAQQLQAELARFLTAFPGFATAD